MLLGILARGDWFADLQVVAAILLLVVWVVMIVAFIMAAEKRVKYMRGNSGRLHVQRRQRRHRLDR